MCQKIPWEITQYYVFQQYSDIQYSRPQSIDTGKEIFVKADKNPFPFTTDQKLPLSAEGSTQSDLSTLFHSLVLAALCFSMFLSCHS